MSAFSRLPCVKCGPESLHKLGACTTCSGAVTTATTTQRTNQTGFNNETTAKTQARHKRRGTVGRPRSQGLTARERQIATLVATGKTHEEVARQFHITRGTVGSAIKRAMDRVGAEKAWELRRYVRDGVVG